MPGRQRTPEVATAPPGTESGGVGQQLEGGMQDAQKKNLAEFRAAAPHPAK